MTACLLYDKIHKNQAENLLHLMLYFSKARRIGIVLDTGGRIEYNTMDIMAEQAHGALAPAAGNAGKNGCGQIPPRCKRGFL